MKKLSFIILILSFLFAFSGCKYDKSVDSTQSMSSTIFSSSDFNKESYIWENFTFPTNRTSGIQ